MRKFNLMVIAFLIAITVKAQVFLEQNFANTLWPPIGWTALPIGTQWSSNNSSVAGGTAPEAHFEGFNYAGTARLVSPELDMSNVDTVILSFRYFVEDNVGQGPEIGVATRSAGSNWHTAWSELLVSNIGPLEFEILITNDDLNHSSFQLSFYLTGNLNAISDLYLDDISLFYPTGPDAKLESIFTPSVVPGPEKVRGRIRNLGNSHIEEVTVAWKSYLGVTRDSLFTNLDMDMFDSFIYEFDRKWVEPFGEENDLEVWITSVDGNKDSYPANDSLSKAIAYWQEPLQLVPFMETYTASWCSPCAMWDEQYVPWCEYHPDITYIKYPVTNDPYYTIEVGARMAYYYIEWIPQTYCNGSYAANADTNDITEAFENAILLESPFEIRSSFTTLGTSITINTSILPRQSVLNCKIYHAVFENITTGNAGSNGMTEFHHTVIKFFPDGAHGQLADLAAMQPYTLDYSANLAGTFVEEMSDLDIVVFIQMPQTNEVLQSAYSVRNANYATEDYLQMITLNDEPLQGFDPDIFQYQVEVPVGTIETPVVEGIPAEGHARVMVKQCFQVPGPAIIDVYPESLGSLKRYLLYFDFMTEVTYAAPEDILIYPNPVKDILKISGTDNGWVNLQGLDGKVILKDQQLKQESLNMEGLPAGIYILTIKRENGSSFSSKIVKM